MLLGRLLLKCFILASLLAAVLPAAAATAGGPEPFAPEPEVEVLDVELSPSVIADEVCAECLGPEPDGWSPLPARHDADWCEHYRPLWGWILHTPLCLATSHAPTGRHVGRGIPLERASWLNRRQSASFALGAIWGGDLSDGTEADSALLGVLRAGIDTSHFAGWEARFAFATPSISNAEFDLGPAASAEIYLFDLNVMYYPWGDSQWRPYTSMGLGIGYYRYGTPDGMELETLFSLPLAVGLKYRYSPHLAFRAEVTDYVTFGGDTIAFRNNLTATAGLEWRVGGRRPSYWPWNPGNQRH